MSWLRYPRSFQTGWELNAQPRGITGSVYVLLFPSLPDRLKVGFSSNVPQRMDQLKIVCGPALLYGCAPGNQGCERFLHDALSSWTVPGAGREMFRRSATADLCTLLRYAGGIVFDAPLTGGEAREWFNTP